MELSDLIMLHVSRVSEKQGSSRFVQNDGDLIDGVNFSCSIHDPIFLGLV